MADLQRLEQWLAPLLGKLQPAEQRALSRTVAMRMRKLNQQNMAAQQSPDGTKWEPRKSLSRDRAGKLRAGPMFRKLRSASHLRALGFANEAVVQFVNGTAAIARVHHYGLRDRVTATGAQYKYPERPLLGINDAQMDELCDLILGRLSSY